MLLVVIGKAWLTDRLQNPDDFVRLEIESALKRGIPVVPVFLEGVTGPPPRDQLPQSLQPLIRRNGSQVGHDPRFHADMGRLVKGLQDYFQQPSRPIQPPPAPPPVRSTQTVLGGNASEGNDATGPVFVGSMTGNTPNINDSGTTAPARDATPAQAPLPRDVLALKADAQNAELEGDLDLAEQLWLRVLAVSSADANAVAALKRIAIKQANLPTSGPNPGQPSVDSRQSLPRFSVEVVTVNPQGQILDRREASAPYQTVDLGQGVTLEMVLVPEGTFTMGSPNSEPNRSSDEGPQHQVTVAEFWMGKYPITQAQWRAVAAMPQVKIDLDPNPSYFKGDNRPVERVSWNDAVEFCDRLSKKLGQPYTLPSEAQWEYACRAGTTTPFHFGETITPDLANYNGEYAFASGPKGVFRQETTEVGSFPPNSFGLYDMHGNVWEWCLDHWHGNYNGAPADGSAWVTGGDSGLRMLRGGSWFSNPRDCRCAYRDYYFPDNRGDGYGFRVVSVPPRTLG